jgi:hypothetical protein
MNSEPITHLRDLREKPMPADVESVAVVDDRSGEPADPLVLIVHRDEGPSGGQFVRGREAGRAAAHHGDGVRCHPLQSLRFARFM